MLAYQSSLVQVISSLSRRALVSIIVSSALTVAPSECLSQSFGLAQDCPSGSFPEFTLFSIVLISLINKCIAFLTIVYLYSKCSLFNLRTNLLLCQ